MRDDTRCPGVEEGQGWYAVMIVIFLLFLHDRVMEDHRPIESFDVEEVRLEWLPKIIDKVPPGLNSVMAGIVLVEIESL